MQNFHRSKKIFYQPFQLKPFITKTTVLNHLQSKLSSLDSNMFHLCLLCLNNVGGTLRSPASTSLLFSCLFCPCRNPKRTWLAHAFISMSSTRCWSQDLTILQALPGFGKVLVRAFYTTGISYTKFPSTDNELIYGRRKSCTCFNYFIDSWKKKYKLKLGRGTDNMYLSSAYKVLPMMLVLIMPKDTLLL